MVADPGRARLLNVRAGRWFDARGDLIKAVRHSVDGGDAAGAGGYIEAAGGLMLWLKEGLSRLPRRWRCSTKRPFEGAHAWL